MDKKGIQEKPIPAIGVGGLVFNQLGQVLLVARKNPPKAGEWHIPGGRLEAGETLAECCSREVWEETGIRVKPTKILAVADRQIDGFHYVIIDFLAFLEDGTDNGLPNPGSDALEAGWFHLSDLPALPIVQGLEEVIMAGKHLLMGKKVGLSLDSRHSWLYA